MYSTSGLYGPKVRLIIEVLRKPVEDLETVIVIWFAGAG